MNKDVRANGSAKLDGILLAVISNRLDTICREMTNTLLRAGRSAVLASARDFSCSLVTADNQLLTAAEGAPVHVLGSHFLTQAMCELHDDLAEGDAFLHNDPYLGNTHHADHTIIVPVFVEGRHLFTACAKAHQADCGNSMPTTYMPFARDIYEEGALNFPCVRIQRNYQGRAGHYPDVPPAHSSARAMVRRLLSDARGSAYRRTPAERTGRQIRRRLDQRIRS